MSNASQLLTKIENIVWGFPLLILLLGGGLYFLAYSRFIPFRYFGHAIAILRGKYDSENDSGEISHFEALSGALAATVGMGNISGVALAIASGGPGALFWMWVSALFGVATKFFTCTLAVLYRGKDKDGKLQGGPMYIIREGLGKKWVPLSVFFSVMGFIGMTPIFQSNQLVDVFDKIVLKPNNFQSEYSDLILGVILALIASVVIFGGIQRIASVASKLVPSMVVLFVGSVLVILLLNYDKILSSFALIFEDAFSAKSILGGAIGQIVILGAKRAAFSNEAGVGTAPLMHGAAKTNEPVREGLVAMLGPMIDTLVICTMTGLCIIVTGVWNNGKEGVLLTANAFNSSLGIFGSVILVVCVMIFAITTIFGMAYYGKKCFSFLVKEKYSKFFNYWYVLLIIFGAVVKLDIVVKIISIAYGLMAIPTMISAILLSDKVMKEAKMYFKKLKKA